jgi:hypothetical protein
MVSRGPKSSFGAVNGTSVLQRPPLWETVLAEGLARARQDPSYTIPVALSPHRTRRSTAVFPTTSVGQSASRVGVSAPPHNPRC